MPPHLQKDLHPVMSRRVRILMQTRELICGRPWHTLSIARAGSLLDDKHGSCVRAAMGFVAVLRESML